MINTSTHLPSHLNKKSTQSFLYISKIGEKDKKLVQDAVLRMRPLSENYEDSWGYIIQATRYDGFKWYDPDTGTLVFFGRKSENDPTLVIPNFFAKPSYLAKVVKKIQTELNVPRTILKNINPKDSSKFFRYGFRPYHDNERWSELARFDDQTYPQLLVDLQNIVELKGKDYHHLRKALRKNPQAYIRPYSDSDKKGVLDVFITKDGNNSKKNFEKGMYYESHVMYPPANIDKFVVIDTTTNEVIGFTSFVPITSETAAFVALVFKPSVGVASVWGIYQTLLVMYQKGYKQINFGGCETDGPFNFVWRTFRPTKKIKKTHLVLES